MEALTLMAQDSSRPYFDRVAGEWDEIRKGYYDESVLVAIKQRVPFGRDWAVADLGAGSGFVSTAVAPLVGRLIALDQSPAMLETMRQNMAARGIGNVEYVRGELERLPFGDGELDAVVANMALHHAQRPDAAIAEMYRVLKPGGWAAITDLDRHENAWFAQEMFDVWMGFDRGEVEAWFAAAGFSEATAGCVGSCCQTTSPCGCPASVSIFIAAGRKP